MSSGRVLESSSSSVLVAEIIELRALVRRLLTLIGTLSATPGLAPDLHKQARDETAAAEKAL